MTTKTLESLQIADLTSNPVWEYVDAGKDREILVRPVGNIPVTDLNGRLVALQVRLANGTRKWALIGNIDVHNARSTEHFLTLSMERDGRWFSLARYHDFDYAKRSPSALAAFLGLSLEDTFPISYDISMYVDGVQESLIGKVAKEPRERLTQAELIAMAV